MARRTSAPPAAFRDIVEGQPYIEKLKLRAELGILPAAVETRLWEYVYGKPAEEINLNVTSYAEKSTEELEAIAANLQEELRQLRASSDEPITLAQPS